MKIYVMRHGKTVWNEKGIIQGRSNNKLSTQGITFTQEIALKFKNINFDIIFVSPLMRAIQTANIMNQYHKVKILKDERITEINQGVFTGRYKNSLTEDEKLVRKKRDINYGIESYQSVYKRTINFLEFLKQQNYDSVLVITHEISATFIQDIYERIEIDFSNAKHTHNFSNAEIKCFDF